MADILREAAGDGRITLEELHERLDGVFAAKTYAELDKFVRDLRPIPYSPNVPASAAESAPAPGKKSSGIGHAVSVAVMSGTTRRGGWVVPADHTAVALMGGVQLDLRHARLTERQVTIRAFALMGGIEVIVPEDAEVIVDGIGIMGGFEDNTHKVLPASDSPGRPATTSHELTRTTTPSGGAPIIRVTGLAFWGGVEVKRRARSS